MEQRRVYGAGEQAVTKGMSTGDLLGLKIEQGRTGRLGRSGEAETPAPGRQGLVLRGAAPGASRTAGPGLGQGGAPEGSVCGSCTIHSPTGTLVLLCFCRVMELMGETGSVLKGAVRETTGNKGCGEESETRGSGSTLG